MSLPWLGRSDLMLCFAFFGLISLVIAWEWPHETVTDIEESDGVIVCDVGDVAPGSKSVRNVPIQNKTSSPLTIKSISRSCSCLATGLDSNTIRPGEMATLAVESLAPNRQGGFRHEILVGFANGQDPITIELVGTVSDWIRSSVSVLDFGDTFRGEISRQRLRLQVREPWPEEQRRIKSLMPYVRIESAVTEDDGKTVTYTIAFQPPANTEVKECEGELVVDWVGHDDRGFKLPCKGKVASEWVSDPPQVVLGKVSSKHPPNFAVHIRNLRHSNEDWLWHYKVVARPAGLLEASSRWDGGGWQATCSVLEEGLRCTGVRSAALCVMSPDGTISFRVPVYWEVE